MSQDSVTNGHVRADDRYMTALTTTRSTRSGKQRLPGQVALWNVVARALGIKHDQRACCAGGTADEQVGRELARLPLGWHVLHATPLGASNDVDVEHLVIGPRGVFNLHTKQHPDATVCLYERGLWVNGHSTVYLHNARSEAECIGQVLTAACGAPVEVQAAIVFVGLAELRIKGTPTDVHITTRRGLRNLLMQQPQRLTQTQVEHIYAVACDSVARQPELSAD